MLKHLLRALLTGACFATLAFSIVSATGNRNVETAAAVPRTLGTAVLTFSNPVLNAETRDLGDITLAGTVVRYLRARGGLPPYSFELQSGDGIDGLLQPNGRLAGIIGNLSAGDYGFDAGVTDSYTALLTGAPHEHSESFSLNVTTDTRFRFAVSQLSRAQVCRGYIEQLAFINGTPPYTFAFGDIKLNGRPLTKLEDVGLSLAPDGTLFGRPYQTGILDFTVYCRNSAGKAALSRTGTAPGQAFSLAIDYNNTLAGDVAGTKIKLQRNKTTATLTLSALVNMNGYTLDDLTGEAFEVRVGPYVSPDVTFDFLGKATLATKSTASATQPYVSASLTSAGLLKATIQDSGMLAAGGLFDLLGEQKTADTRLSAVSVRLGGLILDCDFMGFNGRASGGKASYSSTDTYGGAFMVYGVTGQDSKSIGATKWAGKYFVKPFYVYNINLNVFRPAVFQNQQTPIANIGTDFAGQAGSPAIGGGKFKTSWINSVGLAGKESGIPLAHTLADGTRANFGLKIQFFDSTGKNALFNGENACAIFASGTKWTSVQK